MMFLASYILPFISAVLIGVLASVWDSITIRGNKPVPHAKRLTMRVVVLFLALNIQQGMGFYIGSMFMVMSIAFRGYLNFLMEWRWDYMGTTAQYDKIMNRLSSKIPISSGQLAYLIEAIVMLIFFYLEFKWHI